jgi:hypothetical protein
MLKWPLNLSTRERWAIVVLTGFAVSSLSFSLGSSLFRSANDHILLRSGDNIRSFLGLFLIFGAGFFGGVSARIVSPKNNLWPLYAFSAIYIAFYSTAFLLERLGEDPEPPKLIMIAARIVGLVVCLIMFARPKAASKSEVTPQPDEPAAP